MSNDPTLPPLDLPALAARSSGSPHIPLALIALTLAVFFAAQIGSWRQQSNLMQWQRENVDKQIEEFKKGEEQLAVLADQQATTVKQSGEIQAQFQSFLNDVLNLAKDDDDTKKVVEKWKIQRSSPPASTEENKVEEKNP